MKALFERKTYEALFERRIFSAELEGLAFFNNAS